MSFQGVEFTPEMRKMIVNVQHFFSEATAFDASIRKP